MNNLQGYQKDTIKALIIGDYDKAEVFKSASPRIVWQGWIDFKEQGLTSELELQGVFDLLLSICDVYNLALDWCYDRVMETWSNQVEGINFSLEYKN